MTRADLIDWGFHLALTGLPIDLCSSIGARLSNAMGRKSYPEEHHRAMRLFARLRPELASDPAACEAAVDRLWANIGRTFAEFAVSHRMLRTGRVAIDGRERLDAILGSGRPIVAVFPHLGNWELSEMQIGFRAPNRVAVIVAPPASTARADIAARVRGRVPARLLLLSPLVWREALANLRRPGGIMMIAADENTNGRVGAPSLDRPLRLDGNLGKAARLAMLTKAVVLPFYNERLGGARFVTRVLPEMEFEGDPKDDAAVSSAVERMDQIFSGPVLRLLDQWYMALAYDT